MGHYDTLEEYITDLKLQLEATLGSDLQAENAELRREIALNEPLFETLNAANDRLIYENSELRELVRDYINAPCTTCDCWQDEFRCWNYDGADCGLVARARELGVEV